MPALPTISRPGSNITFSPSLVTCFLTIWRIGVGERRRVVVDAIGNAEAAAEIDMLDGVAVGAQRADQIDEQREGVVEGLQFGDLAADMGVDAGDLDARQLCRAGIDLPRALPRDAELVLGLAGGDLACGSWRRRRD